MPQAMTENRLDDNPAKCASRLPPLFQSAPRSEERGDGFFRSGLVIYTSFNPRPAPRSGAMPIRGTGSSGLRSFNPRPAPRSGAIRRSLPQAHHRGVSIRAPLRGAGRWVRRLGSIGSRGFNPRPAPRSGAIRDGAKSQILTIVSIRAPLRGAGRYICQLRARNTACFNPRPAPRSGAMPLKREWMSGRK